jgi:hypothetical protein
MVHGWMAPLAERAGPLLEAAQTFVELHGEVPRGSSGLRTLCAALESVEAPDDDAERRLAEGAGAVLALLLLDHLGAEGVHRARDGQHRLQLGQRGFFDPFAAVEASLASTDVRAELARQVALAEAEARGEGPVARVVLAFEQALARARPDLHIRQQFEHSVTLSDGTEVDLARIARVADADAALTTATAERLVGLLGDGAAAPAALPFEQVRHDLLPRLVNHVFLAELGGGAPLCTTTVGHDVHLALVVMVGDRARYVRSSEVDAWGLEPGAARRLALRNLAARSKGARFARGEHEEGPLVVASSGDGLDAARLLLPGLHAVLAEELPSPIVAAVPHRDTLLATTAQSEAAVRALARRAEDARARAPHGISAQLFEVRDGGVVPWA